MDPVHYEQRKDRNNHGSILVVYNITLYLERFCRMSQTFACQIGLYWADQKLLLHSNSNTSCH